jgi:hypothetical protein
MGIDEDVNEEVVVLNSIRTFDGEIDEVLSSTYIDLS